VVKDGTKSGTSAAPTVEELMKKLENLNAELKKLKTNDKKGKNIHLQVKMMIPHLKRKSPTKERGKGKSVISLLITLCLLIMITWLALPLILLYSLAKLYILMGQSIINESIA
jgi:hypothetical protein